MCNPRLPKTLLMSRRQPFFCMRAQSKILLPYFLRTEWSVRTMISFKDTLVDGLNRFLIWIYIIVQSQLVQVMVPNAFECNIGCPESRHLQTTSTQSGPKTDLAAAQSQVEGSQSPGPFYIYNALPMARDNEEHACMDGTHGKAVLSNFYLNANSYPQGLLTSTLQGLT